MGSISTFICTSEFILCSTICVYSAKRHNSYHRSYSYLIAVLLLVISLRNPVSISLEMLRPYETHCGHTSAASTGYQGKKELNRRKRAIFFIQAIVQQHPPDEERKNLSLLSLIAHAFEKLTLKRYVNKAIPQESTAFSLIPGMKGEHV